MYIQLGQVMQITAIGGANQQVAWEFVLQYHSCVPLSDSF